MAMPMIKESASSVRPFNLPGNPRGRDAERGEAMLLRQTQDLLWQKDIMMQEMQHRVGNSLQLIASILMLKARSVTSEETRSHLLDAHRQVIAVTAVQQHLHGARQGGQVAMGPYLSKLCECLASSLIGDARPITLRTLVNGGVVPSAAAVSIGLVVAELVINALKYAFPNERSDCRVTVGFEVNGSDWKLVVADNGVGKPIKKIFKASGGLGSSLIKVLTNQLDAKMNVHSNSGGRRVTVTHVAVAPRSAHPLSAA